jgi:phospholipid/cholesterol/gamma-HCH transport system permease protein
MKTNQQYRISIKSEGDTALIQIAGIIAINDIASLYESCMQMVRESESRAVTIDLSGVTACGSAGAAILIAVRTESHHAGIRVRFAGASDNVRGLLSLVSEDDEKLIEEITHPPEPGIVMRTGEWAKQFGRDLYSMIDFLGDLIRGLYLAARHPLRIRRRDVVHYFEDAGVNAVPIVVMIHFLLGVTLAYLGASQLAQFGANVYVADLVGIAMVKEIGPLMTAILVAGRSGASFAAEIGTMKVSEEVDAMVVLGFDTQRFLVIPKVLAVFLAMPGLLLLADCVGIMGSAMVCVTALDVSLTSYITQTYEALNITMIMEGMTKAMVFAVIVAGVGCMRGFETEGGAQSVGRSTTSAVVSGIFLIIIANAIFTLLWA